MADMDLIAQMLRDQGQATSELGALERQYTQAEALRDTPAVRGGSRSGVVNPLSVLAQAANVSKGREQVKQLAPQMQGAQNRVQQGKVAEKMYGLQKAVEKENTRIGERAEDQDWTRGSLGRQQELSDYNYAQTEGEREGIPLVNIADPTLRVRGTEDREKGDGTRDGGEPGDPESPHQAEQGDVSDPRHPGQRGRELGQGRRRRSAVHRRDRTGVHERTDCEAPDCSTRHPNGGQHNAEERSDTSREVHGGGNLWCLDCHDAEDRDKLVMQSGELLSFNDSQYLCGSCHGPILRDWTAGIHGKTVGFWDPQAGEAEETVRKLCVECHDSHRPAFRSAMPMAAPVLRIDGPGGKSSHLDKSSQIEEAAHIEESTH